MLKNRLAKEESEVVTNCNRLKLLAEDGKMRETDAADVETMEASGLKENKIPAKKGGKIARNARIALEEKTGKSVVTGKNFLPKQKNKKKVV